MSSNDQIALAGSGRFEELWQKIEKELPQAERKVPDLHTLCFAYYKVKRYSKLLTCLEQLEVALTVGSKRTRLFGLDDATPTVHLMRGEALLELGQYQQSINAAGRALEWFSRDDGDDMDIPINAYAISSMAYFLQGDRARADLNLRKLEDVDTSWPLHSDFKSIKSIAVARTTLALGYWQRSYDAISNDRAFEVHAFLDKMLSGAFITGKNNWAWEELPRSFMLNKALFGLRKFSEAKIGYDRLLNIPQVKDNGEIYWLLLFDRGQIAEIEGQLDQALQFYRRAIEVIESQRSTINTESNKIGFVGDKQQVYGRLIRALMKAQRLDEAFEYVDRSKSRALVDILASKKDFSLAQLVTVNSNRAATLLLEYERAESEVFSQPPVSSLEGKSVHRNLTTSLSQAIRTTAPELSALIVVIPAQLKEIQNLLDTDEALIQYYYDDSQLVAFVMTRASLRAIPLKFDGLESDIRRLREAIEKHDGNVKTLSQELYQRLISPLEFGLQQSKLIVVPHGVLHYLPFVALHNGQSYFVDRYSPRFLPSSSVLKYLKKPLPKQTESILVFGNPDTGDRLLDLPNAQIEAETVARQMPKSVLFIRKQASKRAFLANAGNYRYIHVASHGQFDSSTPLNSGLLLATADGPNLQSSMLTVSDLYSLQLNADLVTLSACETGLGKISNGDDIVGLTRGFLYAGASSVVASLWQVDDEATAQLMIRFYSNLTRMNKRDALRDALLEIRKKFPDPFYWAAFYLTGNAA